MSKRLRFLEKAHLVNVQRLCIEEISSLQGTLPEYAALSYVWGNNSQRLMLTKADKRTLSSESGLRLDELSRTISDAIRCLDKLQIKHLWVDALCVIQDDDTGKRAQIPTMASNLRQRRCDPSCNFCREC
jgi:Heterokaryon incompatibility protein (HET)